MSGMGMTPIGGSRKRPREPDAQVLTGSPRSDDDATPISGAPVIDLRRHDSVMRFALPPSSASIELKCCFVESRLAQFADAIPLACHRAQLVDYLNAVGADFDSPAFDPAPAIDGYRKHLMPGPHQLDEWTCREIVDHLERGTGNGLSFLVNSIEKKNYVLLHALIWLFRGVDLSHDDCDMLGRFLRVYLIATDECEEVLAFYDKWSKYPDAYDSSHESPSERNERTVFLHCDLGDGTRPLGAALLLGEHGVARRLATLGAMINAVFEPRVTMARGTSHAITMALRDPSCPADLIKHFIDVAGRESDPRARRRLLGASGRDRCSPLDAACETGNLDVVTWLVEAGVKATMMTEHALPALVCAAEAGHGTICKLLVEKGANPNGLVPWGTDTTILRPIHRAILRGQVGAVVALRKAGAALETKQRGGGDPLRFMLEHVVAAGEVAMLRAVLVGRVSIDVLDRMMTRARFLGPLEPGNEMGSIIDRKRREMIESTVTIEEIV
jgi:hypothetical protein